MGRTDDDRVTVTCQLVERRPRRAPLFLALTLTVFAVPEVIRSAGGLKGTLARARGIIKPSMWMMT